MSITKTITVGRPKLAEGRKKVTWSLTIEPELLSAIQKRSKHGKTAAWVRQAIREALGR
jgi:hypothetical protein